jgi:hypothetical protein
VMVVGVVAQPSCDVRARRLSAVRHGRESSA